MQRSDNTVNTVERLRHDIDSGRTRDKVAWPDPAAAPLGSDDEAAGTPPSRERIAAARARMGENAGSDAAGDGSPWFFAAVIVVIGLVILLSAWLG
jgi:hypothetical protein